jgi:Acyl-CoA reductase (LuxC)/Acyl-protein synthetase, LuxE
VRSGADVLNRDGIPGLPVAAFKEHPGLLTSVPDATLTGRLSSSATSGVASVVSIDRETSKRQVRALAAVLGDMLGQTRRPFIVMDADPRFGSAGAARVAATRGFLNLASSVTYGLVQDGSGALVVDEPAILRALEAARLASQPVVVFGFTFVLFSDVLRVMERRGFRTSLPDGSFVVHIGGWKRLAESAVTREEFNALASDLLGVPPTAVVDFYGFTEQMGVTYPDVGGGEMIVPLFADVVVRNPLTLEPCPDGVEGVLQFVTPLPHSYAGISVLTDDIGVVTARDGMRGGRHGTLFRVLGRVKKAEVRGCGDIMGDKVKRRLGPSASTAPVAIGPRLLFDAEGCRVPASLDVTIDLRSLPAVESLEALASRLLQGRERLDAYTVDELIALVGAAARRWVAPDSPLLRLRQQGLTFLADWCHPERMSAMLDRSLGLPRGTLDGPRADGPSLKRLRFSAPRGLAVHWLAGNVPLLGMLALSQSIVTRNANLLKAASSHASVLPLLLEAFRGLEVDVGGGRVLRGDDILASIAVVYFDRHDTESAQMVSGLADVRIAWGGREAVEAVSQLRRRSTAEDIILGPKLSFAVIGREQLATPRLRARTAKCLAVDSCVFDQYACASPHVAFVEDGAEGAARAFVEEFAGEFAKASRRIPKTPIDEGTAAAIMRARLRAELVGELWHAEDFDWTVAFHSKITRIDPTYSRVLTIVPVADVNDALPFVSRDIQTVGLAVDGERGLEFARRAAIAGADRFPMLGRMTYFDSPWDGMSIVNRLMRWISIGGPF